MIDLVRDIEGYHKLKFETKFIILTSSIKRDDFLRAKGMGVDGYILKEAFAEDILYALRVVAIL